MPLSIVTLDAFEAFHERVVDWPLSIVDGDALRESVGAGGGGGGGGSTFVAAGGGATFFAQPVPTTNRPSKTIVTTANAYNGLLIGMPPF